MIFKHAALVAVAALSAAVLSSGCCCMDGYCGYGGCKTCGQFSDIAWQGGCGGDCISCGSCGDACGGSCGGPCAGSCGGACGGGCGGGGCGMFAMATGWCPDQPALAAGWMPCTGPIVNLFIGLRNAFASGGCGCFYCDEWASDPPVCRDPCPGAYGECGCGSATCEGNCSGGCSTCDQGGDWSHGATFSDPGYAAPKGQGSCNCGGQVQYTNPQQGFQNAQRSIRSRPVTTMNHAHRRGQSVQSVSYSKDAEGRRSPARTTVRQRLPKSPQSRIPRRAQFLEDSWESNNEGWDY
jgi:hypothetical protein